MIVEVIAQADVDTVWPVFAKDVADCLKRTPNPDYSAGDYWTMCRAGMAFLIAVHDGNGFLSLSVWRFEGETFCCLLLVGSKMRLWLASLVEKAKATALSGGGSGRLLASGRPELEAAFRRYLPSFRVVRQTYEVA